MEKEREHGTRLCTWANAPTGVIQVNTPRFVVSRNRGTWDSLKIFKEISIINSTDYNDYKIHNGVI